MRRVRGYGVVAAVLLALCALGPAAHVAGASTMPWIEATPASGPVGTQVTITGQEWPPNRAVRLDFGDPQQQLATWDVGLAQGQTDGQGKLTLTVTIPAQYDSLSAGPRQVAPGHYVLIASPATGASAQTTFDVTVAPPGSSAPPVAARFAAYYAAHDGLRLLGHALAMETTLTYTDTAGTAQQVPVQYFEKGRLEDHSAEGLTGPWAFMYGRIVPELIQRGSTLPISSADTSLRYVDLQPLTVPDQRMAPPADFRDGEPYTLPNGDVFIPSDAQLRPVPGYRIPSYFWTYLQSDVFPAGWLHDLGLPITGVTKATLTKQGETREVMLQAFERGILSYDARNPVAFRVERANVGTDYVRAFTPPGPVVP